MYNRRLGHKTQNLLAVLTQKRMTFAELWRWVEVHCGFAVQITPEKLPPFLYGFTIRTKKGYCVYYDPRQSPLNWLLTIIHEFGHILEGDIRDIVDDPAAFLQRIRNTARIEDLQGLSCHGDHSSGEVSEMLTAWEDTLDDFAVTVKRLLTTTEERSFMEEWEWWLPE